LTVKEITPRLALEELSNTSQRASTSLGKDYNGKDTLKTKLDAFPKKNFIDKHVGKTRAYDDFMGAIRKKKHPTHQKQRSQDIKTYLKGTDITLE